MPDDKIKIQPSKIKVDPLGKVVISDKALADKIKNLLDPAKPGTLKPGASSAFIDVNFGC